ncbi:hypothetical protein FV242_32350 [Methylobacterium sp. WL64]|uniref:hypothetical protein n=1 Tax=Methylobacterium sp. WL64 TaxID=2603894 RepID=UPI0011C89CCB|nr:hypothetical protein [Methylobacterium sp. WL64]TXM97128.1 hypothetical protein FV242_32350 [Methylobacterium sp. WL64]
MPKNNDRYYINAKNESMLDFLHTRSEMKLGRSMYYVNRGCDEDDGCMSVRDLFATALVLTKTGLSTTKINTDLRKTIDYLVKNRINLKNFEY